MKRRWPPKEPRPPAPPAPRPGEDQRVDQPVACVGRLKSPQQDPCCVSDWRPSLRTRAAPIGDDRAYRIVASMPSTLTLRPTPVCRCPPRSAQIPPLSRPFHSPSASAGLICREGSVIFASTTLRMIGSSSSTRSTSTNTISSMRCTRRPRPRTPSSVTRQRSPHPSSANLEFERDPAANRTTPTAPSVTHATARMQRPAIRRIGWCTYRPPAQAAPKPGEDQSSGSAAAWMIVRSRSISAIRSSLSVESPDFGLTVAH